MKVIICGAGRVGSAIARHLSTENDVTIIDQDAELIQKIGDSLDVKAMVGHASRPDMLEAAGAKDADMVIAVTFADEVNMVACQIAHSIFDVPTKIARIREQAYLEPAWADLFTRDNMPIDVVISPEIEVARAIERRLEVPGTIDMVPCGDGKVRLIGVHCNDDCPVINTPLRQLTELFPDLDIMIVGVVRDGRLSVPHGDDQLFAGDDVYFVAKADRVTRAVAAFGHEEAAARRMIIVGGGHIGLFLAQDLEANYSGLSLKIIEYGGEQAAYLADRLSRAVVLHGDALEREILGEANVSLSEAIIAVTADDETNILVSLLAKRYGCAKSFTLVNNNAYWPLLTTLGIDVVVSPQESTVSTILQYVRRGRIHSVHSVRDGAAEMIEAEALETSPLVGRPLNEIKLPEGIVIGAIIHDGEVEIPRGSSVIRPKDRLVVFAEAKAVKKLESMFSVRLEFF